MGKYRATLNMPEAKRGQVAIFDDTEPRVIRMVCDGHLVPVDVSPEALARIEEAKNKPAPVAIGSVEAVKRALEERRRAAGIGIGGATTEVSTAVPVVTAPKTPEEAPEAPEVVEETPEAPQEPTDDEKPTYAGSRGTSQSASKKSASRKRGR